MVSDLISLIGGEREVLPTSVSAKVKLREDQFQGKESVWNEFHSDKREISWNATPECWLTESISFRNMAGYIQYIRGLNY